MIDFSSKYFCILPWIHIHINNTGNMYPCCVYDWNHPISNIQNNTIEESLNNAKYKNIRKSILKNKPVLGCKRCYEKDITKGNSLRKSVNKLFSHHFSRAKNTFSDGYIKDFNLIYLDIRLSNDCNLMCASCNSTLSSRWASIENQNKSVNFENKVSEIISFVGKYKDHIEVAYFAGGEPFLMDSHYRTLNILENKEHINLFYNTNFTVLKHRDFDVLEILKKYSNVTINASIDGVGKQCEYLRKGLNWHKILENRIILKDKCPHIKFKINYTLSLINSFHLPVFLFQAIGLGLVENLSSININIVQKPECMQVTTMPIDLKANLIKLYEYELVKYSKGGSDASGIINSYKNILNLLHHKDTSFLINEFKEYINKYDKITNQSFLQVFPEFASIF